MAHICREMTYQKSWYPEWLCSCGKRYSHQGRRNLLFPILEKENEKLKAQVVALKEYIEDNTQ